MAETKNPCARCDGKGAIVIPNRPSEPVRGAYWFERGAICCLDCDGTGAAS